MYRLLQMQWAPRFRQSLPHFKRFSSPSDVGSPTSINLEEATAIMDAVHSFIKYVPLTHDIFMSYRDLKSLILNTLPF